MKPFLLSLLPVVAAMALPASAAPQYQPVHIDPAAALREDPDFAIQGEFAGKLDGEPVGLQLIAEGKGKFSAVLYPGGLPGAGWDGVKARRDKGSAETVNGTTKITIASRLGTVTKDEATFGKDVLTKVSRTSPTLGAKPPAGAVVLFDGSSADAWTGSGVTEDKLLRAGQDSRSAFGSYSIHLEFLLPYKPFARGQDRGNSGFYNQSRYEVQILDSFGLEGENNECGGIYSIKAPDLNMCLPPLVWQTYDIDYTAAAFDAAGKKTSNARITVKHNGVVIHKDVELPHATTAAPRREGPEPGPLHLQNHGNPVQYRNIWLVEKK